MKLIKNIIVILSATLLLGCSDDFLNVKPQQSILLPEALSTEANLRSFIIGAYEELGQTASFGGRTQIIADLLGNTNDLSWQGTFIDPRQLNSKNVLVNNTFVSGNWGNNYEVINQVNLVLDNINLFVDPSEKTLRQAEAKFLRAMAYFDLIRNFAKQYDLSSATTDLGVPLRSVGILDYTADLSISRSSVQDVYNQIMSDLSDSYTNLPYSNGFFADKYAARALQARVYLQMGDYKNAVVAANDVIMNSGNSLVGRYQDAFNNDDDSKEDIFTFQVTDQTGESSLITFYASEENGGRGGDIYVNNSFVNSFDSPHDDRASFFLHDTGDRLTAKYSNQFANISVFRLAEMYLIRAEGNFREGTNVGDTPLNDINTIRTRSNASELSSVDLNLILRERKYELAFEGFLIHDLKRTRRNVGGIPFNNDELVLPIPQSEMDTNSKMVQNPGYLN